MTVAKEKSKPKFKRIPGPEAAKMLGIRGSWFRQLVRNRGINPIWSGPDGTNYFKSNDIQILKKEKRHPGRPRNKPAAKAKRK